MNVMTFPRLIALLLLVALSMPVSAASDDDVALARNFLRCAAFYVFGSTSVTGTEVKQELQDLANKTLYAAEILMDKNRPVVKAEFDIARQKFFAELSTGEVKADRQGFLKFMGEYCNVLRENNRARFSIN